MESIRLANVLRSAIVLEHSLSAHLEVHLNPVLFSSLPLAQEILTVVSELGFQSMTPIQQQSIQPLLEGKDLIGQSQTGSGKTAAFAIPILQKINLQWRRPQALVLCPTRELADQVSRDIRKLGRRYEGLQVQVLSGGHSAREQSYSLERGVHIVVGTPGRLVDLLERGSLDLRGLVTVVMDEADKMLEMGFEDEINAVMSEVPNLRQTVFFSATFPKSIEQLSEKYQKNPLRITIAKESVASTHIDQTVYEMENQDKDRALLQILRMQEAQTVLIFCNQKVVIKRVLEMLEDHHLSVTALHGDLEQYDRDVAMALFRNGSCRLLVATDVAARGLDVDHLDLVINYDLPIDVETYVHRIGRTGRAGRSGVAISFAEPSEKGFLSEIREETKNSLVERNLIYQESEKIQPLYFRASMKTLRIVGGRKDKLRPGDILGALTGDSGGLTRADVGKIEVHDRFSFVAIATEFADKALQSLRDGRIKNLKFRVEEVE